MQESFHQLVLLAIEIQDCFEIDPFSHDLFPYVHVLLSAWETVKQIPAAINCFVIFFIE